MSLTVDCGEGKHDLCSGWGRHAYMFPQNNRDVGEPPFNCGCKCHKATLRSAGDVQEAEKP